MTCLNRIEKIKRHTAKALLRSLSYQLERKWAESRFELDALDYQLAAQIYQNHTGCSIESAIRFFYRVEDLAEWKAILGDSPSIKCRLLSNMGNYEVRLPK